MFYLPASETEAVKTLEQSIERLKKNLTTQEEIKDSLMLLKKLKEKFLRDETSKEEAWKMVRISRSILQLIEHHHLEHLFAVEFLEELKIFSSYAKKSNISLKSTP